MKAIRFVLHAVDQLTQSKVVAFVLIAVFVGIMSTTSTRVFQLSARAMAAEIARTDASGQ